MGKKLIIPAADFSANAFLNTYMKIKVAANSSVQMHYQKSSDYSVANYGEPIVNNSNSPKEFFVEMTDYFNTYDGTYLFYNETSLLEIFIYDNKGILTSLILSFYMCSSLKKVSIFASKLKNMHQIFSKCLQLSELSILKTGEIIDMYNAFRNNMLKTIDLSRVIYGSLKSDGLERIFGDNSKLTTIDMSNISISSNVKSYDSQIFTNVPNLSKVYVDNVSGTYTDTSTDLGYIYYYLPNNSNWTLTTEEGRMVFIKSTIN